MSEIAGYRLRVEAVRRELAALAPAGWGEPGPPDPSTGERWDRGHVLAHLAEMVPFWTGQVRAVLAGGSETGRGEDGYAERKRAIETAHGATEERLLGRIDAGIDGLLGLLADMREEDLDRRLTHRTHAGAEEVDLRRPVEVLLVGHLEAHLRQLRELT